MNKFLPVQVYQSLRERVPALPKTQFPSIPLDIPEVLLTRLATLGVSTTFLSSFALGFLIMAVGIVGFDVRENLAELSRVKQQREIVVKQAAAWQGIVAKYDQYRDGYYQLAVREYQLGNELRAHAAIVKALEIDPDFVAGKAFARKLSK